MNEFDAQPEAFDPSNPEAIEKKLVEIHDDEGPLALEAAGDPNYLHFLQEDAVANLDILVHPDREDVQERRRQTGDALAAYKTYKFGTPRP